MSTPESRMEGGGNKRRKLEAMRRAWEEMHDDRAQEYLQPANENMPDAGASEADTPSPEARKPIPVDQALAEVRRALNPPEIKAERAMPPSHPHWQKILTETLEQPDEEDVADLEGRILERERRTKEQIRYNVEQQLDDARRRLSEINATSDVAAPAPSEELPPELPTEASGELDKEEVRRQLNATDPATGEPIYKTAAFKELLKREAYRWYEENATWWKSAERLMRSNEGMIYDIATAAAEGSSYSPYFAGTMTSKGARHDIPYIMWTLVPRAAKIRYEELGLEQLGGAKSEAVPEESRNDKTAERARSFREELSRHGIPTLEVFKEQLEAKLDADATPTSNRDAWRSAAEKLWNGGALRLNQEAQAIRRWVKDLAAQR